MSNVQKLSLALALVSTAGAAAADGLTYSNVEAVYGNIEELDVTRLNGEADYIMGQYSFTGSAGLVSAEGDDASILRGTVGYAIIPGLNVYGLLSYSQAEGGNDETSYGLGAEFQNNDYGVALEYEKFDDADIDSVTLAGFYGFGASTVYGFANEMDNFGSYGLGYKYDAAAFEANIASLWDEDGFDAGATAFSGAYDVNAKFTVLASVLTTNDNFLDNGIYTVGGSYNLTDTTSVEANYGQSFGSDIVDGDGFTLALSFETGARRVRVTDQVTNYVTDTTPLYDLLDF
ncbi:hypothetical protein [Celeribacter baekdonensis]|uniref:hypothetical protein n=1 Tax=Celeribacter baekdonensis TaxID=875171 RepID=UPI003A9186D6